VDHTYVIGRIAGHCLDLTPSRKFAFSTHA
jgi:hypothetical protein